MTIPFPGMILADRLPQDGKSVFCQIVGSSRLRALGSDICPLRRGKGSEILLMLVRSGPGHAPIVFGLSRHLAG